MKVLLACEESQAICIEFRKLGHEAYSCDLQECSGGHPEWHIQYDVFDIIEDNWDLVISFPPCTDLTVSGAKWFPEKRNSGKQEKSIRFFFEIWKKSNCCENPIGILNSEKYVKNWFPELYLEMKSSGFPFKPTQIIRPYQFGENSTKSTCLWLRNIPKLKPTNIVKRTRHTTKSGKSYDSWWFETCLISDLKERAKIRSKTFPGIAKAIAEQWGNAYKCKEYKQQNLF